MEDEEVYLMHHGILGQKWGVRRYQNKDGSYTAAGLERRNSGAEANERMFERASKSARVQRTMEKRAITAAENASKYSHESYVDISARANRNAKKAERAAARGNDKQNKAFAANAKFLSEFAEGYLKKEQISQKFLSDVKNGTLKAGRDYIAVKVNGLFWSRISIVTKDSKVLFSERAKIKTKEVT